jgi:hypothetical protein
VSLLALPETTLGVLHSLFECFASVGVTWDALTGEHRGGRRMAPRVVAATSEPWMSPAGLPIAPQASLLSFRFSVVCGWRTAAREPPG